VSADEEASVCRAWKIATMSRDGMVERRCRCVRMKTSGKLKAHGRIQYEIRLKGNRWSKAPRGRESLQVLHSQMRQVWCRSLSVVEYVGGSEKNLMGGVVGENRRPSSGKL